MDPDSFRKFGHEIVDWLADYLGGGVGSYPVRSLCEPGEVAARLPGAPPEEGEEMERILGDFREIILPGMTHWQHPSWFAYFPASNSPPSVLAELLTAGLGAQCMLWQTSPAAQELEEVTLGWLGQLLGLPVDWTGVIQDTASTATLCALLTARERATGFEANEKGALGGLTVYTSEEAHSSVEKGARIAGYGSEMLRVVPTDDSFAMVPHELGRAIAEDQDKGLAPACVVATVGTTSSSGIDPLVPLGEICRERGVWLHVDAAYAGTAAILPEKRWIIEGVELADSFVFNPHKWMLTNFDCSAYFVRDAGLLTRTFEIHPEYLKTGVDARVKNYRDWGIQLGRRFRALKLWFVIRSYGAEGLRRIVGEHIRLAGLFREWVEGDELLEVVAPSPLSLVCFRINDGRGEAELDALNERLKGRIDEREELWLTHTTLKGRYALRMAIGSRLTEERHVRHAFEVISDTAREIAT